MKIFVTGSTGYVGSAVVRALVKAGHQVTGLFFSPDKEALLKSFGAAAVKGSLDAPQEWEERAAEHDAILHTGFVRTANPAESDRRAVEAMLSAAKVKNLTRCFVYTSGVWVLGNTGAKGADESGTTNHPADAVSWRPSMEEFVLNAGTEKLSTAVIRPGLVYGGKAGILAMLWGSALKDGAAQYVGEGQNHWPLVHREDLAQLYRLVAEKAAKGVFHGVDNHPLKVLEVAQAVSRAAGKNGAVKSWPLAEAQKQLGPFAEALALEQKVTTKRSLELGWKPSYPSFLNSADQAFKEFNG